MTMCVYCKNNNFTKEEYKNFKSNMQATAKAIRSILTYRGGMYYNTSDLFNWNAKDDIKVFIIQELKKLGIEFIENNTLYRVTD